MKSKLKIELLPSTPFLKKDGTFDKESAIIYSAQIAGECYEMEGWKNLKAEPLEKSKKRANLTLNLEHHSVYDHVNITFELSNVPKILAMILNNEHQYNTSEKSARYTKVVKTPDSIITKKEETLYNKWMDILKLEIKKVYEKDFDDRKIEKLAQENARYLVTVFMPTQMIYTVPFGHLNKIVSFLKRIIDKKDIIGDEKFSNKLIPYLKDFVNELSTHNLLDERLQGNRKNRSLSLFAKDKRSEYFGDTYSVNYKASFAQLAQAQRHRTLNYEFSFLKETEFFVPPILLNNKKLVDEWNKDMKSVSTVFPNGQLILVNERGTYENFILKCKERICTSAQLEIMLQTHKILEKYEKELKNSSHPLKSNISLYTKKARCTFSDYECALPCKFKEGINLTRQI